MTAAFCRTADDRSAATWQEQIAPFDRLEFVVSDAAKGITAAVARIAAARRDDPAATDLEHGLDLFHTAREARTVLARHWRRAEADWAAAEAADAQVDQARQQGRNASGVASTARAAWRRAAATLGRVEQWEAAWGRARAAFELFGPDGRLQDRASAEAAIGAALPGLAGPEWAKVRRFLIDRRSLAYFDRLHRRLESAEPRRQWREALAWRWWLRQRRPASAAGPAALARAVGRDRPLSAEEQAPYARIAAVLSEPARASSAVECLNSVLRMQQSRHRRMTQPMLDLKRLYWNCHAFRSGPRRRLCPYRALGLALPTFEFWELLHTNPAELAQRLSTQEHTE